MNLFIELHIEILRALIKANVEFIVIGGYSVIFHGYERTTGDIDIWLKPDNENKKKLLPVLSLFGFDDSEIAEVSEIDFTTAMVFSIGETPEKIDFLSRVNLVDFDTAYSKKIISEVDGLKVPFMHLDDLVLSKFNTGRSKDKADIEMLQLIAKAGRNRGGI